MVTRRLGVNQKYLRLFIILSMIQYSQQKRDFHFQLETCDAQTLNPDLCSVNCTLTDKGDLKAITGFMDVLDPADSGGLSVEMLVRPVGTQKYRTLINQTVPDICVYLKGNNPLNIVKVGIDELMKSGKVPGCPVEKDVYYIKNFYISPEYFPPIMPEAEWKAKGKFFGNKHGKQHECASFSVTGKLRRNDNSFWNKITNPML